LYGRLGKIDANPCDPASKTLSKYAMSDAIDYFSMGHPLSHLRSKYALRARERMFLEFMQALRPGAADRILDLGVTPDTSLPESNYFEQRYPWPHNITAASIEDVDSLSSHFDNVHFVQIKPGPLPFKDKSFDILFCSAVLEHVGSRESQKAFVLELLRVSHHFFITTPNRWFPLEFHTILPLIHWLPQPTHQLLLRGLGRSFWAQTDNLNLLGANDLKALFPPEVETRVDGVKLLGLTSNLIAWA
jgi:SAM-dependent methyltransferase